MKLEIFCFPFIYFVGGRDSFPPVFFAMIQWFNVQMFMGLNGCAVSMADAV